jgi:hypothetical protein
MIKKNYFIAIIMILNLSFSPLLNANNRQSNEPSKKEVRQARKAEKKAAKEAKKAEKEAKKAEKNDPSEKNAPGIAPESNQGGPDCEARAKLGDIHNTKELVCGKP